MIVMPEMALVMLMSGECSACATPCTDCEPSQTERAKVESIPADGTAAPSAIDGTTMAVLRITSLYVSFWISLGGGGAAAEICAAVSGGGGGGTNAGNFLPLWTTIIERTAWSFSRSMCSWPSFSMLSRNLVTLLPNRVEAVDAIRLG